MDVMTDKALAYGSKSQSSVIGFIFEGFRALLGKHGETRKNLFCKIFDWQKIAFSIHF